MCIGVEQGEAKETKQEKVFKKYCFKHITVNLTFYSTGNNSLFKQIFLNFIEIKSIPKKYFLGI